MSDEVYRAVGLALLPYGDDDDPTYFEWHECTNCPNSGQPCACAGHPYPSEAVRAAVEAARAPLLAEIERLRRLTQRPLWMCSGGEMVQVTNMAAWLGRNDAATPPEPR